MLHDKYNLIKIIFVLIYFIKFLNGRVEKIIDDINLNNMSTRGCSIRINEDLTNLQPLFIIPTTENFWYPQPNGIIYIPYREKIELYCSTSFQKPFNNQKFLLPECYSSKIFLIKNKKYNFENFICNTSNVQHIAQRINQTCHQNATLIRIGFNISRKRFLKIMKICHDENIESTLYVHHELNPSSNSFQKGVPRIRFLKGDFFKNKNVNLLYTQKKQKETIGKILQGNHEKYFNEKKLLYLARGHLSAKVDHIYGTQQRATFYFINAAPQWQKFNAGNWERIEDGVRRYVANKRLSIVDCYTGTWDVLQLKDINENYQKLYLSIPENKNESNDYNYDYGADYDDDYDDNTSTNIQKIYQIPVPKFFYRVVIDRLSKKGIVFVGVNNPHATIEEIRNDYILCDDIGDQIKWINWKKNNIQDGYSYACDVNQFRKIVNHLPELDVKGLLI